MKALWITFLFLNLLAPQALARDILWLQQTAQYRIPDSQFSIWGEAQFRRFDWLRTPQMTLLRTATLYELTDAVQLGLGFGWMPQFTPSSRNEFRVFEQATFKPSNFWGLEPRIRTRLEQRSIEGVPSLAWRIRSKEQLSWMPSELGLYSWGEVFYHLNSAGPRLPAGFDQVRISVGARYKHGFLIYELGYLAQALRSNDQVSWNHGIGSALLLSFE